MEWILSKKINLKNAVDHVNAVLLSLAMNFLCVSMVLKLSLSPSSLLFSVVSVIILFVSFVFHPLVGLQMTMSWGLLSKTDYPLRRRERT